MIERERQAGELQAASGPSSAFRFSLFAVYTHNQYFFLLEILNAKDSSMKE
jgi:hypothetical protein